MFNLCITRDQLVTPLGLIPANSPSPRPKKEDTELDIIINFTLRNSVFFAQKVTYNI